jgi:hypothetical protein
MAAIGKLGLRAAILVLVALFLAGCSGGFQAGDDDDNDGDPDASGGGEINVDDEKSDEDTPGLGFVAGMLALAGAAASVSWWQRK